MGSEVHSSMFGTTGMGLDRLFKQTEWKNGSAGLRLQFINIVYARSYAHESETNWACGIRFQAGFAHPPHSSGSFIPYVPSLWLSIFPRFDCVLSLRVRALPLVSTVGPELLGKTYYSRLVTCLCDLCREDGGLNLRALLVRLQCCTCRIFIGLQGI